MSGLTGEADTVVTQLPYGQKRALEIATTLALDPEMMLLDEPTAGMGHGDVDRIVELIRRVRGGRTILMVEHNLSVVEGAVRHHHRADPRPRAGRGRLCLGVAQPRRDRRLSGNASDA